MTPLQPQKRRTTIWLSEYDLARLRILAAPKQTSISQLVREAITYAILNKWSREDKKEDYE